MSDLRTRIAAVLWAKDSNYVYTDTDHLVRSWDNVDGVHRTDYYELADALIAAGATMPAPQSDYAKHFCRSGCDCSCCYGMDGCYHVTDPCNCGQAAKDHRHA